MTHFNTPCLATLVACLYSNFKPSVGWLVCWLVHCFGLEWSMDCLHFLHFFWLGWAPDFLSSANSSSKFSLSQNDVNIFSVYWHKFWCRHSWFPDDVSEWLWWPPDFSSRNTSRFTFLVQREMSEKRFNGLPLNFSTDIHVPFGIDCTDCTETPNCPIYWF